MNHWHKRFQVDTYLYGKEPNEFLKNNFSTFEGARKIGVFAEGEGRNAVFLSERGFMLTAYDFAQSGLDKTKKLASVNHVHVATRLVDLIKEEVPTEQFGGAVMIFGQFAKKEQKNVFDKVVQSVLPGGKILMELFSEEQLNYHSGGPTTIDELYAIDDVKSWCEAYKLEHFFTGEVELQEGELHRGKAHVIQLIIKK